MALLKFLKGNYAGLSAKAISEGQVLICGDTGEMFVDVAADKRVKIGDFVVVSDINALEALDASSVPTSRLYYVENGNILARSNGTSWTQINKQKTLAELGGVSKSVYDAKMTALDKADSDNATAIDNLSKYVGTIPTTATATDVVGYINEKTSGIASEGAMTELGNRVTQAEKDIDAIEADYLKAADKTELTGKITTAQTAADNAQTYAEGVAGDLADHEADAVAHITAAERAAWNGKTTMAEVEAKNYLVAADIAGKANASDVYTKDEIDGKVETLEGAIDLKANAADVYDKDAIDAKVEALEGEDDRLEGLINGKVAQTAYDTKVGELVAEDERLAGLIEANETAIANEVTNRGTAISGLKTELEGKINLKADQTALEKEISDRETAVSGLQTQLNTIMNNPDAEGAINSINEFTQYVADHGTIADGFRADIDKNKADIAAEVKRAGEAESALSGRLDTLEAIDHDAYVAADTALKNELNGEIAKKADKTALEAAVETLEGVDTAIKGRLDVLEGKFTGEGSVEAQIAAAKQEAIDTAAGDATTKANKALEDAKKYADNEDAKIEARLDALELIDHEHANKALLDTYTQTEANLADAVAKKHEHANSAELAKIADGDVAKWNAAEQNAKDYTDAQVEAAKTDASNKDAVVLSEAQKGIAAAKTELQGNIDTVSGALNTYKTENNAAVALKANAADVYTKTEVETMLTWGEF